MSATAWLGLAVAGTAALAFSFWIYLRREVPIVGRRVLAVTRAAVLALLVLLLLDPAVPGRSAGVAGRARLIALDASLSMTAASDGQPSPWERATARLREISDGEVRVVRFGGMGTSLDTPATDDGPALIESRLAPPLERALSSGADEVIVLSDMRVEDPVAVRALLERGALNVRFENVGGDPSNAGVADLELPASVEDGQGLVAGITVYGSLASEGQRATVEVREEDRLVQSSDVDLPALGRLLTLSLPLPPPVAPGPVRYEARVRLATDVFPDDDMRARFVERNPEEGLLVVLGLVPDWEPRFLLPVLTQVTGLQARAYLRVGPDRYVRSGESVGVEGGPELRPLLEGAEILILLGLAADTPTWVEEVVRARGRLLVFPVDDQGAALAGVAAGSPLEGEWYPSAELPPSPLAADLGGSLELQGLPPLTRVLPVSREGQGQAPLNLQLRGRGPGEPALLLISSQQGRRAVALAGGFWRWGFRRGAARDLYRRLWAGVAGWLLADEALVGGALFKPVARVLPRGASVRWTAPGAVGRMVRITLLRGEDTTLDTTLTVPASGMFDTPGVAPGSYLYRGAALDGDAETAAGRLEIESYTDELRHAPVRDLLDVTAASVAAAAPNGARPLRTHPLPYLLLLGLLCGEWIWRRRKGLR